MVCVVSKHGQTNVVFYHQDWETEWHQVLEAASDIEKPSAPNQTAYDYLEDIHVFVLANVIRRPIIILGHSMVHSPTGEAVAENNFPGIYLPLLWHPSVCVKSPIVLGYSNSHFSPLLGTEIPKTDKRSLLESAVPLVTKESENLVIRFLKEEEESHYDMLNLYMDLVEINLTRSDAVHFLPCAKLKYKKLPQFDLVKDHLFELQKIFTELCEKQNENQNSLSDVNMTDDKLQSSEEILLQEESINFNTEEKEKTVALKEKKILEPFDTEKELNVEMTSLENPKVTSTVNFASSLEHKCSFKKCTNFTTAKTYPYCQVHRRKRSNSFDEVSPETGSDIHVTEQAYRNSMNAKLGNLNETSKPCKAENCSLYGLKEWGYMCSQHRYNKQISEAAVSNEWHKCRNPDRRCSQEGKAYLSGLCNKCYLNKGKSNLDIENCKNPHCERLGKKQYNSYCCNCALDFAGSNEPHKKTSNRIETEERSEMDSMNILGLLPGRSDSEMKNAREFYKCIFDNCRQLSTESTLGLCTDHFIKMFKKGLINIPTENEVAEFKMEMESRRKTASPPANQEEKPFKTTSPEQHAQANQKPEQDFELFLEGKMQTCSVPGCPGIRCSNPYGMCFFCYDANKHNETSGHTVLNVVQDKRYTERESPELIESVAPESSSSSFESCRSPVCENRGKRSLKGLCDVCFNILCKEHARIEQKPATIASTKYPVILPYRKRELEVKGKGF